MLFMDYPYYFKSNHLCPIIYKINFNANIDIISVYV